MTRSLLITTLALTSIACTPVIDIPPGFEGAEFEVPFWRSEGGGLKADKVLTPGRHILTRMNSTAISIDTRPKIWPLDISVRTADDLNVTFHVSLTTKVKAGHGPQLLANYATVVAGDPKVTESEGYYAIITPVFEAVTRARLSKEQATQVAKKREEISSDILAETMVKLADEPLIEHLDFQRVTIGNIDYPQSVNAAIEKAVAAKAELAEKEQRIKIAEKDAEIRRVEATGIAAAQAIIDSTLSVGYLRHEWIMALKETAQTENTTIIYVPVGYDGLPIMTEVRPR